MSPEVRPEKMPPETEVCRYKINRMIGTNLEMVPILFIIEAVFTPLNTKIRSVQMMTEATTIDCQVFPSAK